MNTLYTEGQRTRYKTVQTRTDTSSLKKFHLTRILYQHVPLKLIQRYSPFQIRGNSLGGFLREPSLEMADQRVANNCQYVGRSRESHNFIPHRIIAAAPLHCKPLFPSLPPSTSAGMRQPIVLRDTVVPRYSYSLCYCTRHPLY